MNDKEQFMQYCLELTLESSGFVSPNPLVGAIIVRNNEIIGEGYHKEYGGLHAEVEAINDAKEQGINDFSNTTLYVNLEPCSHQGKQPPCADAIIEAKIPNVIIGMEDPNPIVAGKGIDKLRKAGINVEVGVLKEECQWINRFYCHYITSGMPYIILKIAQTIDGCIATKTGESKWITSEESRRHTHFLRSEMDAIVVGVNTILCDNPLLDTRLLDFENENNIVFRKRNPKIIILDSQLRTPENSNVLTHHKERDVFIIYSDELKNNADIDIKKRITELEAAGAILWEAPMKNGKIHLRKAISRLTVEYCFTSLLVEGGAEVFSSFVNSNLVDEIQMFTAPVIMGDGKRAFCNVTTEKLEDIKRFSIVATAPSDIDEHLVLIK